MIRLNKAASNLASKIKFKIDDKNTMYTLYGGVNALVPNDYAESVQVGVGFRYSQMLGSFYIEQSRTRIIKKTDTNNQISNTFPRVEANDKFIIHMDTPLIENNLAIYNHLANLIIKIDDAFSWNVINTTSSPNGHASRYQGEIKYLYSRFKPTFEFTQSGSMSAILGRYEEIPLKTTILGNAHGTTLVNNLGLKGYTSINWVNHQLKSLCAIVNTGDNRLTQEELSNLMVDLVNTLPHQMSDFIVYGSKMPVILDGHLKMELHKKITRYFMLNGPEATISLAEPVIVGVPNQCVFTIHTPDYKAVNMVWSSSHGEIDEKGLFTAKEALYQFIRLTLDGATVYQKAFTPIL